MRLVPTAEGGFTLEPAGAAEPPREGGTGGTVGGGTAGGTAGGGTVPASHASPASPATPASTPAPATPDPEPEPATAATDATARAASTVADLSSRGTGSTEGEGHVPESEPRIAAEPARPASGTGGPRGVGIGLPPRAARAPKPRPSELPRQDSLD
jgi:hypothetical protein